MLWLYNDIRSDKYKEQERLHFRKEKKKKKSYAPLI